MLPEIKKKIKTLGRVLDPEMIEATIRMYAPLWKRSKRDGVTVTKDVPYGAHDRQKVDIYRPDQDQAGPLPVLVFVHGGGFVMGDKMENRNIGYYFARHGILTLIPSYRLAPEYQWPSGAQDVAGVLELIKKQGRDFGGNTDHVFLMGHSAGAAHVASYLYGEEFKIDEKDGVAGGILISPPVLDPENVNEFEMAYYGKDASKYQQMAILPRIKGGEKPVFILVAEYDPPAFDNAAIKLVNRIWQTEKIFPFFKKIIHHNHISEVVQFNTGDPSVGPDIMEFINSVVSIKTNP